MSVIVVPAGRCVRRSQQEKWIDPQPEKGTIEISLTEGIVQFVWRDKESSRAEEELLIFPGEATFEPVSQDPTNRTHILKFSSSNQKYFFWFQRSSKDSDARVATDINAILQDPSYQPGTAPLPTAPAPAVASSSAAPAAAAAESSTAPAAAATTAEPAASEPAATSGQPDLARMLSDWAATIGQGSEDDARLPDVLSPNVIAHLLATKPALASTIAPLLPAELELGAAPTAATLLPVLSMPQFSDAIASLDSALRSGGLPPAVMREIGLPETAGTSVRAFLAALLTRDGGDQMETD